jgi:peptidoglycan hydrolase-like protein with peptidoglycan-binding domain
MNLQGRDLQLNLNGNDVQLLHTELAQIGLPVPDDERQRDFFGQGTHDAIIRFQQEHRLAPTGVVDAATARAITQAVDASFYAVVGTVVSPDRVGVGGLRIQIVDKNVGQDVPLADAVTDERGRYTAHFAASSLQVRGKARPDLQARVYAGQTFLAASAVRYNATNSETLHVTLPANASTLPSEYETLTGTLATHYRGRFGDLKESDDQQDITYLANKTGWDARAVALAALADQCSQQSRGRTRAPVIDPAFYYALFRAGVPANPETLYQVDAQTVTRIWQQAMEQGVISSALQNDLPSAVQAFQNLSAVHALDARALPGSSTLKEMLHLALGNDASRQQQFANLWTRHRSDLPTFWNEVQHVFGEATTKRLQLDGQLGYLTLSNAPLMSRLHAAQRQQPLSSTLDLVRRGYYRASQWTPLMDGTIPASIPGSTPEEKRGHYAELLATQVRLSFPTAVVAEMVGAGELSLTTTDARVRDGVRTFLSAHQGEFEIGIHPIEQYLARNRLDNQVDPLVKEQIKRLQRVYQITPNDRAMAVLLQHNLDSAYQIVRYDEAAFVQAFNDQIGGEEQARLTYAKAQQVHNAVLNIASSYLTARLAPALGFDSQTQLINPAATGIAQLAPNTADVIAYPTLEQLFGSMDFCACEHCRSILSPAAYLVDLLYFLDRPVPPGTKSPQEVLLDRRPDIQHLPLTCENTNTPLPYIDVVNETLEYFVTHNLSLADYIGHDTDDRVTTEELMASPQFVNDAAYNTLKTTLFPPPLPFHQPLESLRRTFEKFATSLPEVMETLRTDDAIERANASAYGWRDILMEQLALSRAEYTLLTDRTLTLKQLYGYPLATLDADVLASLSNAKAFTRRMDLSYEELVEILKTRFVNPNSILLPQLEHLGVPFATLKTLKESQLTGQAWLALLPKPLPDASQYGGNIEAWVKNPANYANFMSLITLTTPIMPRANSTAYRRGDCVRPASLPAGSSTFYECTTPGTSAAQEPGNWPVASGQTFTDGTVVWTSRVGLSNCSFDTLRFRYADPDKAAQNIRGFEFVRILRFIRLWKKLGWTIEQTDKALTALYPANQTPNDANDAVNLQRLDAGFLVLLPRLGVVMQVMRALNLRPQKDLLDLLACWSPIDIHGVSSLYRRMFLSHAPAQQDAAFADDGFGNFLKNNLQTVMAHAETLCAAFALTAAEFSQIVGALGLNASTPLTLNTISAIYRRGWLARTLHLSVQEFLLLTQHTGLDPFAPPDPANPPIRRFLELVQALRTTSLKPTQALYLLWNQDISGTSAPTDRQLTDFARQLRDAFTAIEREFAVVDDPSGDIARARMAMVYGSEATDFFFGLLGNTFVVDVPYSHPQSVLEQPILDVAAGRLDYDDFHKRLSYSGVLSTTTRDALKAVARGRAAFATAMDALYAANQAVTRPFFSRYPELQPLYTSYAASTAPPEQKRTALLANLLPELKRRRKRQQALIAVSAAAGTESTFTSAILDDVAILRAAGDPTKPALDDLTALETSALAGEVFWSATVTGPGNAAAQAEAITPIPEKIWNGYLEVLENDFYKIAVEVKSGAPESIAADIPTEPDGVESITLILDKQMVPLVRNGTFWESNPVSLAAGTLYPVVLRVKTLANTFTVRWKTTGRGWEVIPTRYLYPAALIDGLRSTYVRFLKAASLSTGLKLTTNEMTHFGAHTDYYIRGQGWLNALATSGAPDTTTAQALRDVLVALLEFARIKARLSPDDERLLTVLKDPSAALPNGDSLLLTLTRWESSSLNALLVRFGQSPPNLAHMATFRRVYEAARLATTVGISASTLITATTNEPDGTTVRTLRAALRARYHESDWLSVVKPMHDDLRGRQRDALVAYILQQFGMNPAASHIDTPDKLFEYFLMDVQMEPGMQTSRIRHTLSSVQLFIERCLMNLEPRVAPTLINAEQWAWMKRYRVWEANRKVFLWPENWLEPELRDDQSPFFKETMSELLQSDITEDTAATAMLNYLSKLEEVAKLGPCGMHYIPGGAGTADDIVHVVARTAGASRKYYYRRRENTSWAPWEQIKLEIEDNPVVPTVWNGRLFLFWIKILKQVALTGQKPFLDSVSQTTPLVNVQVAQINTTPPAATVQAVLCWSEYYNGKWQPTKTSDIDHPNTLDLSDLEKKSFDRSSLLLEITTAGEGLRVAVFFEVGNGKKILTSFMLYNTHSLPVPVGPFFPTSPRVDFKLLQGGKLHLTYMSPTGSLERDVLSIKDSQIPFAITKPRHPLPDNSAWYAPFFFEDSRHVFYVSTTEPLAPLAGFQGYGGGLLSIPQAVAIAPVVLQRAPLPDGVGELDPVKRSVTEDVNIRIGIGTSASIRYSDQEIGQAGAMHNGQNL